MGIQINGQTDTISAIDGGITVATDLTVPGVLSYDDVTNIDSVGVVTARSGLHVTGGNVGIGTDESYGDGNASFSSLSLGGNGTKFGLLEINKSDGTAGSWIDCYGTGGNGDLRITTAGTSGKITFWTGGEFTEKVTIASNGNVGIAITTPSQKLHVNGAGMFELGVRGPMQYNGSYTANSNLDITGFGYGNYIVSVRSGGVYHWNGVLMVTMYDTADFGVQTLVSGNYSTTLTASMVNLSAGNGTLRLVFNRDIGDVRVSVIQIG